MLFSSWKCYVDSTLRTLRRFNVENWTWNQLSYRTKYQRGNLTLIQRGKHHVDSTLKTRGFNVENTWNQIGKHDVESTWKTRRWFNFQIEPNINVETTSGHDVDSTWIQRNCACWVQTKSLKLTILSTGMLTPHRNSSYTKFEPKEYPSVVLLRHIVA